MSIISFCSKRGEKESKSEVIVAIVTHLAIKRNYKILILDTGYKDYFYKDCYWKEDKTLKLIQGTNMVNNVTAGINGLSRAVLSNKTSPEIITNYTRIVFKDRLEVLSGEDLSQLDYEVCQETYKDIAKMASKYYDLVFVDISNDLKIQAKNALIEISDLVLIDISQKLRNINAYMKERKESILQDKCLMPFIGRYDKKSKYNTKNIARYLKEKQGIHAIPYNTLFFEACNEGRVADFFIKFRNINQKDKNAIFMNNVDELSEKIIYRLQELQMQM